MAMSFRIIFWIPVVIFFIFNLTFKLIIFLLQHLGLGIVWLNRQFIKGGDYFTDKAKNDESFDEFMRKIQVTKEETRKRVNQKRGVR